MDGVPIHSSKLLLSFSKLTFLRVLSELRLVKLVHNTIKLLASTTTVAKAVYLLNAVLSNESFATKHKTNLINQGNVSYITIRGILTFTNGTFKIMFCFGQLSDLLKSCVKVVLYVWVTVHNSQAS